MQCFATTCPRPGRSPGLSGEPQDQDLTLAPDDVSLAIALGEEPDAGPQLEPAWPNPFRGQTRFAFAIAGGAPAPVRVTVVDLAGRAVRVLADGTLPPGRHELAWDGRDENGWMLPGGVYFLNATVAGRRMDSRLTLLR